MYPIYSCILVIIMVEPVFASFKGLLLPLRHTCYGYLSQACWGDVQSNTQIQRISNVDLLVQGLPIG